MQATETETLAECIKVKLLFENWREYLNEEDYSKTIRKLYYSATPQLDDRGFGSESLMGFELAFDDWESLKISDMIEDMLIELYYPMHSWLAYKLGVSKGGRGGDSFKYGDIEIESIVRKLRHMSAEEVATGLVKDKIQEVIRSINWQRENYKYNANKDKERIEKKQYKRPELGQRKMKQVIDGIQMAEDSANKRLEIIKKDLIPAIPSIAQSLIAKTKESFK